MSKVKQVNFLKSSDISLLSALCVHGYSIQKIERQDSGKAVFWMERDEKIDDLIQKFFNHKLEVDALGFFNALKELKTRIYNVDR